jgi:hypothetical protein
VTGIPRVQVARESAAADEVKVQEAGDAEDEEGEGENTEGEEGVWDGEGLRALFLFLSV